MSYPWQNRNGTISALKSAAFLGLWLPGLWYGFLWATDSLGPRVMTELIHGTGLWAIRFLLLSLAITPFRVLLKWPDLIKVRRMIGVAALCYALVHIGFYCTDLHFEWMKILTELVSRTYLIIGGLALFGLIALGGTSTDSAVRALGGKTWQRLHRLTYVIATLALIHFLMQSKLDLYQPALMVGLFFWLMGYRAQSWWSSREQRATLPILIALAITATVLSIGAEALWHGVMTRIPGQIIFYANFMFANMIRPSWWVLAAGVVVIPIWWIRRRGQRISVSPRTDAPIRTTGGT